VEYAFKLVETTQYDLEPGTNFIGQFVASGQPVLFCVRLPAASPFFVALQNNVSSNRVELYAKLGVAPTRGDFDYCSQGAPGPNQQLLLAQMKWELPPQAPPRITAKRELANGYRPLPA